MKSAKPMLSLLAAAALAALPAAAAPVKPAAKPAAAVAPTAKSTLIDVRTPEEYAAGHLDGAANIPFDRIGEKITAVQPDKTAPVHLYCKSGRRAEAARQTLLKMGYTDVTNHGGYEDLKKRGVHF